MKITFYGHSTFALEMAGLTIVTDPCSVGYPQKPARADVITESHQHFDHNDTTGIACPRVLSTKGEWEIGGVSIATRSAYHDDQGGAKRGENLIFVFQGEGLSVAHLGDLGHVSGVDGSAKHRCAAGSHRRVLYHRYWRGHPGHRARETAHRHPHALQNPLPGRQFPHCG